MLSFHATIAAVNANHHELVLAAIPQPLLVVQPDRRLVYANRGAEQLFEQGLATCRAERLMAVGELTACRIEELLRQADAGYAARAGLWFRPGMRTGWLEITPVAPGLARSADWPSGSQLLSVHFDDPALSQTARIDALCQQCRLTATERYVLMLLADGQVVESVARQLGLQVSTLRSHVRNLLGKTRAASLMQLMRWLGSNGPLCQ